MAAPRATQFIALRNLARGGQQVRQLHITGPATYSAPVLLKESPVANLPRDVAGLRAECKRRKLDTRGPKKELIARLSTTDLAGSRAMSTTTTQAKRPSAEQPDVSPSPVRNFVATRPLAAARDNSTIDFFYFPALEEDREDRVVMRVPILPDNYDPPRTGAHAPEEETVVMKPEINTMSLDSMYLPMADMTDGHAMGIDFHAMADRVAANIRSIKAPAEEQASIMKQLWSDMVDDMLGLGKKQAQTQT